MSAEAFDLGAVLDDVARQVDALPGVRSAKVDPHDVRTPGVWVTCTGFETATLAGGKVLDIELVLLVDEDTHRTALRALSDLYAVVETAFPPLGRVTPRRVDVGGGKDDDDERLPGLAIPTRVRWTPDH